MDKDILNKINQAEAELWTAFAQHHELNGHTIVYDVKSPSSMWSNSIYPSHIGHSFHLKDASLLETFYQVHGLEGFLRDFNGAFERRRLATFSYLYFDPNAAPALASPSELRMHKCEAGELGLFAEEVRAAYGHKQNYVHSFRPRIEKLLRVWPGTFYVFKLDGHSVGVLSLIKVGALSRILHFAVRPEFRGRGYGIEILQNVLRRTSEKVFVATEIAQLVHRTFPAAGFHHAGSVDIIPLHSLLR